MSEINATAPQRILVPMDFSEAARAALRTALGLARSSEDVVQVFYLPGFYARTEEDVLLLSNPFSNGAESAGQRFRAWAEEEGFSARIETLPQIGIPDAEVIADMATRLASTLIVLTPRQYKIWERFIGRCPLNKVLRTAPCRVHLVNECAKSRNA
jgi:nucleotide-binding universal stress UspA family protein